MNTKLKDIFSGKVVNKSHNINTGVDEFPRYVLEYLIDDLGGHFKYRKIKDEMSIYSSWIRFASRVFF